MIDLDELLERALILDDTWPKLYVQDPPFDVLLDEVELGGANHPVRDRAYAFMDHRDSTYSVFVARWARGRYEASYERFDAEDDEDPGWTQRVERSVPDVVAVSRVDVVEQDADEIGHDEDKTAEQVIAEVRLLLADPSFTRKRPACLHALAEAPPRVWFEVLRRHDVPEELLGWVAETATWQPLTLLVAIHPSTPADGLLLLSRLWPDEVVENMGLALHLLTAPGDFRKLSERAQEAYRRRFGEAP